MDERAARSAHSASRAAGEAGQKTGRPLSPGPGRTSTSSGARRDRPPGRRQKTCWPRPSPTPRQRPEHRRNPPDHQERQFPLFLFFEVFFHLECFPSQEPQIQIPLSQPLRPPTPDLLGIRPYPHTSWVGVVRCRKWAQVALGGEVAATVDSQLWPQPCSQLWPQPGGCGGPIDFLTGASCTKVHGLLTVRRAALRQLAAERSSRSSALRR